ncbi:MAG TPA: UDP-N-acetylmuramoyl-L-alanyl-D-glutamate--2,6-diaminopimelate ligase [Miltoncostaeaceae bacterium]|nr:UDP-N-acetylmuramoyl-L-alanyl-D-glutamate--2,6-diaminopimelate ligase [Miltoncostaeaceae bacterium]
MRLQELTAGIPGARTLWPEGSDGGRAAPEIEGIAYRSDEVRPGWAFACLPGARFDGHDFAGDAVARGAAALVVERPLDQPVPQVLVADARLATALIAAGLAGRPSDALAVVGVTGTNGKTTSAFLLHAVLDAAGLRPGLLGTIEARVGGRVEPLARTTPESVDLQNLLARMRDAGDRSCAMEVSSHALAQRRVAGVRFAAAIFTNLTRDHLDYHADVDEYYLAKRALFMRPEGEGPDPPGAANLDDPFGRRLAEEAGLLGFAVEAEAEVRPVRIAAAGRGFAATVRTPRGPLEIESALRGRFNVANVTGVVAAAELLGLDRGAVARGIAAVRGVPGRFEPVDAGQPFEVLVDYAHTPDSLENVLREARALAGPRRVLAVFGCGGDRDRGKRPQMGAIARALADVAIVTSDNPRTEDPDAIIAEVLAGAADGPAELVVEADRRRAIGLAVERAAPGDVVVIAGKGHERGQERDGVVSPFDDREVALAALGEVRAIH